MLQANELRIGNYLQWNGKPFKVNTIFTSHVCSETQPLQGYEPIPLTPEILEKCGFEYDTVTYYIGNFMLLEGNNDYRVAINSISKQFCDVKYLHELQNCYFMYKKEELEINL